jgi:curved DNA-binding protein CbpA
VSSINPYRILGLVSSATAADIKAAYKRLAFAHHPDRNKGSLYHTERFKEVVEAYDILSDPDKRARFDRAQSRYHNYIPPSRSSGPKEPQKGGFNPGGSPYGRAYGFDPLRDVGQNQPDERTFTARGGRRYTYPSPHQIFIALLIFACTSIGSLWFGTLMDHQTARNRLAEGDYISALEYDSTFGEAWFVLAENQAKRGYNAQAYENTQRAFRLTDAHPPNWFWARGRLAEKLGAFKMAKADYEEYYRAFAKPKRFDTAAFRDSSSFRLSQILLYQEQKPDSAYLVLQRASLGARERVPFLYLKGLCTYEAGRYSESIPSLQAAADSGFRRSESYYLLGLAYWAIADTATACIAWDIALTSGSVLADSLLRKWCTFEAPPVTSKPLTIYVKP